MTRPERIPVGDRVVVYQRGKKRIWCADYWFDGKHCRKSLKTKNKKLALAGAVQIDKALITGTLAIPAANASVADCIEQYLAHLKTEGRSPKTLIKYRGIYHVFLGFLQSRGIRGLNRVTVGQFDSFRAKRHSDGAHLKTRYTEGVIIKQLLRWAKSRRLISDNPLDAIKLEKPRLEPRPGPSISQVNDILSALGGIDRIAIATLAFTGIRAGELQRIQMNDVDANGNWLSIVSREGLETKTRASRRIPIHLRLRHELDQLTKPPSKMAFYESSVAQRIPEAP